MTDSRPRQESDRRCPRCDASAPGAGRRCEFCGASLGPRPEGRRLALRFLSVIARAYRIWTLGLFAVAVLHLVAIGQGYSYFALICVVIPFGMALTVSYRLGDSTPRGVVAFLILVDLGVVIAPEHRIFPRLHQFGELPPTQCRILTWYFLVYFFLQFVAMPPVAFSRSLRTAWQGGKPTLSPSICLCGLAVWGLLVLILVLSLVHLI